MTLRAASDVVSGTPVHLDASCVDCHLEHVYEVSLMRLTVDGLNRIGVCYWRMCRLVFREQLAE